MKIAFDLDDVLFEFNKGFLDYYGKKYNKHIPYDSHTDFYYTNSLGISSNKVFDEIMEFYQSQEIKLVPAAEGSLEVVTDLKKLGHELFIITSRPDSLESETKRWVNQHFPNKFKDVILTSQFSKEKAKKDKGDVSLEIGVKAVVDDSPQFAEEILEKLISVYMPLRPWNEGKIPKGATPFKNWQELLKYFNE